MGYSCRTLLRDTLVRHSSGTLLRDTLVGLSSSSPDTPRTKVVLQGCQFSASSSTDCSAYSSCTTKSPVLSFQLHRLLRVLKLYYKVASSQLPAPQIAPRTRVVLPSHQFSSSSSPDTPRTEVVLQSRQCSPAFCVLDTHDLRRGLRGHRTNRTLVCISRTRHAEGCARMGQIALSPAFRALDTHDLRRGLRAHGTNRTLACISHTRRARSPQRVARQVSKTSVSRETSSKTHTSKSAKRAFRTRLPPQVKRKHPSEHTHHAALPSSFAIPAPPNKIRSHANPNVTATFTSTTTHNLTIPCACHESFPIHTSNAHKVLRLPRNVTSLTPRNLTIPCACHENRTSTLQNPHEVLRLPRKVTISSHVSFNKICTTPQVWNDFDPF